MKSRYGQGILYEKVWRFSASSEGTRPLLSVGANQHPSGVPECDSKLRWTCPGDRTLDLCCFPCVTNLTSRVLRCLGFCLMNEQARPVSFVILNGQQILISTTHMDINLILRVCKSKGSKRFLREKKDERAVKGCQGKRWYPRGLNEFTLLYLPLVARITA